MRDEASNGGFFFLKKKRKSQRNKVKEMIAKPCINPGQTER